MGSRPSGRIFIRPFEKRSYYVIPLGVRPSIRGWSGGAMVRGNLPVPGRPTNFD